MASAQHPSIQSVYPDPVGHSFAIRVVNAGESIVFALEGEADLERASVCFSYLKEAVCESGHQTVIVDLSACEFMDTSILKTLIEVEGMARERKRNFILARPSRTLQRTFALVRMEQFVTVTGALAPAVSR